MTELRSGGYSGDVELKRSFMEHLTFFDVRQIAKRKGKAVAFDVEIVPIGEELIWLVEMNDMIYYRPYAEVDLLIGEILNDL